MLWDFGDTLADERFAWELPGVEQWSTVWQDFRRSDLIDGWDRGDATVDDVAVWLGERLDRDPHDVLSDLAAVCQRVELFPGVIDVVRRVRVPQAIVTINPDLFLAHVVPACAFDALFDVIVTSSLVGSLEKADVCDGALERLGVGGQRGTALLIDNIEENVEAWRARGGVGYHFCGEEQLLADLVQEPLSLIPIGR